MSLLEAVCQRRLPSLTEATAMFDDAVAHRAELAGLELDEARTHAQTSALLLAACAGLVLMSGLTLTLIVTVLVWNSPHRAWWLAGLALAYLAGAIALALALRHRLRVWQPFAAVRSQLQQDHQCLTQLAKSIIP